MNFKRYLLALSVLITFLNLPAYCQRDTMSLNTIISKTNKFVQGHPLECIYIHTDKPYYSVGDTIWFKAYVTAGLHQPSELSRIMYVDIASSRDSLVQSLKLQVFNGVATGAIALKQSNYKQGNYHLTAYTNWMRNFDPAYFFNKTIPIANPVDNPLFTNITFPPASATKGKQAGKLNVRVQFKDATGTPYSGKKVSWSVDNDDDKPLKGKDVTDANGFLNISATPNPKTPLASTNLLYTALDLGDRKPLNSIFPLRNTLTQPDVQFFPEGGTLVSNVRNRVAFKALKPDGLGADVSGTVVDDAGKTVIEFKSQNLGMGSFIITPEDGKTYKANVVFADGSQNTYSLPNVKQTGVALAVYNINPDTITVKVTANAAFYVQNEHKPVYITGQSNGIICYAAQTTFSSTVFSVPVPKNKFPTGIVQFTIFMGSEPLGERIVFVQHNYDMLNLSMTAGGTTFKPRQQVKMLVMAKAKNLPSQASISVSVIDETKVPFNEDAETTILTSLLLTSQLKGYIEKPNYYFNHQDAKTVADLDVLMLTQGYRRFIFKDVLGPNPPRITYLPEQGMEISGVLRTQQGIPVAKGNIRLLIPDKNYSTQTTTDMSGVFKFTNLSIPDSAKVVLNARNNTNANNLMLMVDGQSLPGIAKNTNLPDEILNIDSVLHPYMVITKMQYNNSHVLKEVEITSKAYVPKRGYQDFTELTGLSYPDHSIDGERLKDCQSLAQCLQTMLLGLTYDNNNFYITRDYNAGKKSTPVAIFYNGLQVDYNYLSGITNAADVTSVETFLSDGLSGINNRFNTSGVIEITTRETPKGTKATQQQIADLFPPKYIATLTPKGFDQGREFYSPKYIAPPSVTQRADLRSTIYWNSRLITDKTTGAVSFDFYNADTPGNYRAVVEGIDAQGNIGRFVLKYKVQ